jgi:hypothetical protein
MKTALLVIFLTLTSFCFGQSFIAFGAYGAYPQNDFKKASYKSGYGGSVYWVSRHFTVSGNYKFQYGLYGDWAKLGHRDFSVTLNTPVADNGKLMVRNESLGFLGILRNAYDLGKYQPYADLVFGPRVFKTVQIVTPENPDRNPDYEKKTVSDPVVLTSRFHYGIAGGTLFQIAKKAWLDVGFIYTLGNKGAVQPLKDILKEGNELRYKYTRVKTDFLMIRLGLVFEITPISSHNEEPSEPYQENIYHYDNRGVPTPATEKRKNEIKPNSRPKSGNH